MKGCVLNSIPPYFIPLALVWKKTYFPGMSGWPPPSLFDLK